MKRYCQLKSKWADSLSLASNLKAEHSLSDEVVYGLILVKFT